MAQCLGGVTKILTKMNQKMNVGDTAKILQEFQRQNAIMEQSGEIMEESLDDAFAESDV